MAIVSLVFTGLMAATASPKSQLSVQNCELGELYSSAAATCNAILVNLGDQPIRVSDFVPMGFEGSVEPKAAQIAAHAQVSLSLKVDDANGVGDFRYGFRFHADEPRFPQRVVSAHGFMLSIFDDTKPAIDFGDVDLHEKLPQKEVTLSSQDVSEFSLVRVLAKPEWLDIQLSADHHGLTARIKPDAPWGRHDESIKLAVAADKQKEVSVSVRANIRGDIVTDADPVDLGTLIIGEPNEHIVRLTDRTGKDLSVAGVRLDSIKGAAEAKPCKQAAKSCREIRIVVSNEQPFGAINGKLSLEFPAYKQNVDIAVHGSMLKKGMKLANEGAKPAAGTAPAAASAPAKPDEATALDLRGALHGAAREAAMAAEPPPPGNGPLLKWTVAQSGSIYGFQIFRSDTQGGPFRLLNAAPLRSTASDDKSVAYQWRDSTAVSGNTYWYRIGLIKKDGTKQSLTEPQKALAK